MPVSPFSLSPEDHIHWMVDNTEGKLASQRTYFVLTENWTAEDWGRVNSTIDALGGYTSERSVTYGTHPRFGWAHVFAVNCLERIAATSPVPIELVPSLDNDAEVVESSIAA